MGLDHSGPVATPEHRPQFFELGQQRDLDIQHANSVGTGGHSEGQHVAGSDPSYELQRVPSSRQYDPGGQHEVEVDASAGAPT